MSATFQEGLPLDISKVFAKTPGRTNNNTIKKVELSKIQLLEINQAFDKIDFSEIENNISIDDLAVDKAIKGTFKVHFKEKFFKYEFNHNKLPKDIQELFKRLEAYLN
mgnify:CR=1 FL=1